MLKPQANQKNQKPRKRKNQRTPSKKQKVPKIKQKNLMIKNLLKEKIKLKKLNQKKKTKNPLNHLHQPLLALKPRPKIVNQVKIRKRKINARISPYQLNILNKLQKLESKLMKIAKERNVTTVYASKITCYQQEKIT